MTNATRILRYMGHSHRASFSSGARFDAGYGKDSSIDASMSSAADFASSFTIGNVFVQPSSSFNFRSEFHACIIGPLISSRYRR